MELEGSKEEANDEEQQGTTNQAGRPPIILTSTTNLLRLQKQIKGIIKGISNGTRVLTKEMADFSAIKTFFLSKKLSFYSFFPSYGIYHQTRLQKKFTKRWWNLALM
jgi:hypothetical protein